MGTLLESELIEQLNDVGNRLSQPPLSIAELLKLLDEVETLFTKMRQSPSKLVQEAFVMPKNALIGDKLFRHSDPNVRITVASCLNEVTRISAPTPPYDDDKMRELFELIVSSFENLSCGPGRCYSKAVQILLSVAKLRSCVVMLDLDCDWLITKMFELFQKNISPKHPQPVLLSMVKIMSVMIQESDAVSLELLQILLDSIKMENQNVSPTSWEMGVKIFEGCADKLKPFIKETVLSMGCSLEDYAPILLSICKPEDDENVAYDSPSQVNNKPSGNSGHASNDVLGSKARESSRTAPASSSGSKPVGTEGTTSRKGGKSSSNNFGKEAAAHENKRDDVSKKVKEEAGDNSSKKSRPPKKDVPGLSGDKALKKRNDVSGASGSSGKKLVKQPKELSSGSGNKSKMGKSRKDELPSNDSSKNQRKRASSSDDEDSKNMGSGKDISNTGELLSNEVFETPHGRKHYKDDLVGARIKVWWPLDRRYYEGTITSFEAPSRKHRVDYDDGDEEVLNLMKERWEFLGDENPTDIASLFDKENPHPSIVSQHKAPMEDKKETPESHNDEKEITPASEAEPGDAINHTPTVVKSEIPQTLHQTKKPRLSDGQSS